VRATLQHTRTLFLDLFDTYLHRLELELEQKATHSSGRAHGIANSGRYYERIAAVDFAMEHDDGQSTRGLDRAEIILIAPSRCGKTPTSIYLALQHALFATNFPLTEEDLESQQLPATMQPFKGRLFGLTSDPARLHQVRNERRSGSKYASLAQCAYELRQAEQLYRRFEIPFVNSANMSIEEIATVVLEKMQLRR
jgi:regulator of PEP synthase PpsR (kinase-PPPase family)